MNVFKMIPTIFICIAVILSEVLLLAALKADLGNEVYNAVPEHIGLTGIYRVDGGEENLYEQGVTFDVDEYHTIVFRGHFTRNIEKNEPLSLHINKLRVTMKINGKETFSYGMPGTYTSFSKSTGNQWLTYISPGIQMNDEVEFTLQNIYIKYSPASFNDFFQEFDQKSQAVSAGKMETLHLLLAWSGLFTISFGFALLFIALLNVIAKLPEGKRFFLLSLFVISFSFWLFCDSNHLRITHALPYQLFRQTVDILTLYIPPLFLMLYCATFFNGRKKMYVKWLSIPVALFTCTAILLQFNGTSDVYELQEVGVALILLSILGIVVMAVYEAIHFKDRQLRLMLKLLSPMLIAMCAEGANFLTGFYFYDHRFNLYTKIGFFLFVLLQFIYVAVYMKNGIASIRRIGALERELAENRIKLLLSQIQPHFLYNSLAAIRYLCRVDPARAEAAIVSFSSFLRGNLDALTATSLIPFSRELAHVQQYLGLEKMRFANRLHVVYRIDADNFMIPPLTLQPLVENAVRYCTMRREAGTVTITSEEIGGMVTITVTDDGEGYDPAMPFSKDRARIGIKNVKERLRDQCGATLEIRGAAGSGTEVVIRIPKRKKTLE